VNCNALVHQKLEGYCLAPARNFIFIVACRPLAFFIIIILVCAAIGTVVTPGLLCQPQVIVKMIVEKQMECRLAGETAVLREKLPQRHTFVHHKIPHDQTRV
jgi:hypothetical protein